MKIIFLFISIICIVNSQENFKQLVNERMIILSKLNSNCKALYFKNQITIQSLNEISHESINKREMNSIYKHFLTKCSSKLKVEELEKIELKPTLINERMIMKLLKNSLVQNSKQNHFNELKDKFETYEKTTVFSFINLIWFISIFIISISSCIFVSLTNIHQHISKEFLEFLNYFLVLFCLLVGRTIESPILSLMVTLLGLVGYSESFALCWTLHPQLPFFQNPKLFLFYFYLISNFILYSIYTISFSSKLFGFFTILFLNIQISLDIFRREKNASTFEDLERINNSKDNTLVRIILSVSFFLFVSYLTLLFVFPNYIFHIFEMGILFFSFIIMNTIFGFHSNNVRYFFKDSKTLPDQKLDIFSNGNSDSIILILNFTSIVFGNLFPIGTSSIKVFSTLFLIFWFYLFMIQKLKRSRVDDFVILTLLTGIYFFISSSILNYFSHYLF
eukprot:gene1072-10591_t